MEEVVRGRNGRRMYREGMKEVRRKKYKIGEESRGMECIEEEEDTVKLGNGGRKQ